MTVEITIHPDFINKKVDIENEKVDIAPQKVDIQELKVNYIKRLRAIGANKSTLEKIDILLNAVELEQIFGRTEVVNVLNISPTAASKFIGKMCQVEILEAVEGKVSIKCSLNYIQRVIVYGIVIDNMRSYYMINDNKKTDNWVLFKNNI